MLAIFSKGISGGVLELAKEAKMISIKILLITDQYSADKMRRLNLFDEVIGFSSQKMYDTRKLVDFFFEVQQKNEIETVFSCYDPFGPAVCDILQAHYNAGLGAKQLKSCYIKSNVRKRLSSDDVDDLPFFEIHSMQDIEALKNTTDISSNNKWVLKPSFGTSSELVSSPLNSYGELCECYRSVLKSGRCNIKEVWFDNVNIANVYLLERYVDGEEYSVDGICINEAVTIAGIIQKQGLTIINGIRSEGVNFAPIKETKRFSALSDLAREAVRSLRISNTPFHIEMRWDKKFNKPRVIELNPRLPGGLLCNIHKDRHGVNLARLFLHARLNRQPEMVVSRLDDHFYGDLPLPTTKAGIYKGVSIPEKFVQEISEHGEVEIIDFLAHGEVLDPSHSEVYFAHAYIRTKTEDKFWKAVQLCEEVFPLVD